MKNKIMRRVFTIIVFVFALCMMSACGSEKNSESVDNERKTAPMQSVIADNEGLPREQIGNYKIWTESETDDETGTIKKLSLYATEEGGDKVLLEEVGEDTYFSPNPVSDGEYVYYSLSEYKLGSNSAGAVYKIALDSGEKGKLAELDSMLDFAGIYNDVIYYTVHNDRTINGVDLYSYSLKEKESELVKENFSADDQFGSYMVGTQSRHDPNVPYYILNLETGEFKEILSAWEVRIRENGLSFSKYTDDNMRWIVGECDYSGNIESEKEFKTDEKMLYLGRNKAYILDETGDLCKFDYGAETVEPENFDIEQRLTGHWENFLAHSVAETVELDFDENGRVTCTMPRDIYYGTYEIKEGNVYMEFNEGEFFVQGAAEWEHEDDIEFRIKGKVKYNRIDLEIGDTEGWNVAVAKFL